MINDFVRGDQKTKLCLADFFFCPEPKWTNRKSVDGQVKSRAHLNQLFCLSIFDYCELSTNSNFDSSDLQLNLEMFIVDVEFGFCGFIIYCQHFSRCTRILFRRADFESSRVFFVSPDTTSARFFCELAGLIYYCWLKFSLWPQSNCL